MRWWLQKRVRYWNAVVGDGGLYVVDWGWILCFARIDVAPTNETDHGETNISDSYSTHISHAGVPESIAFHHTISASLASGGKSTSISSG